MSATRKATIRQRRAKVRTRQQDRAASRATKALHLRQVVEG